MEKFVANSAERANYMFWKSTTHTFSFYTKEEGELKHFELT